MRSRIVGLTVLAAVLATCLFGIPLTIAAGYYFISDEQRELERTADVTALAVSGDLTRARREADLPAHENGLRVSVYDAAGVRVAGSGAPASGRFVQQALNGTAVSGNSGGRIVAAVAVSDGDAVVGAVVVTVARGLVYARIARAWGVMLLLALGAVGVSWLVARRLSRRIAEPVQRLALAAERLGDGDFSVRTTRTGIAEIDTANRSLDRTAARLGSLVERERAFSADASHQLRTPLAGLELGLEAALSTPDADLRAAVADALSRARQLETTVGDLLAMARDRPRDGRALDIGALVSGVRLRWNGLLAHDGRPLRIVVDRHAPRSRISTACVTQVLDVLIDNALRHGRGPVSVTVRDAGGALAIDVTDDGPPLAGDSRELFRRRSTDAAGTGIGLALARRLAEAEGGRLVLSAGRHPRFTLLAPADPAGPGDPDGAVDGPVAGMPARARPL